MRYPRWRSPGVGHSAAINPDRTTMPQLTITTVPADQRAEVIAMATEVLAYLKADYQSMVGIMTVGNPQIGKCGVGVIAQATAAMDWFGYLFHGDAANPNWKVRERFDLMLGSGDFDKTRFTGVASVYEVIRCGVVHQVFGKGTCITRNLNNDNMFLIDPFSQMPVTICADAVHKFIVAGLEKMLQRLSVSVPDGDIQVMHDRLWKRWNADRKSLLDAMLDNSNPLFVAELNGGGTGPTSGSIP